MSQKSINIVAKIVKIGIYILPVMALLVGGDFILRKDVGSFFAMIFLPGMGDMLFPFITAKSFFFRICVEIIFAFWVLAAMFDRQYRPKRSPILWSLAALLVVLTLSTVLGANPYRSFWSNYERMEGLIGHMHLFLYFLVLISVFKTEKDWWRFFHVSLAISLLVGAQGVFQILGKAEIHQGGDRIDATLGNATYLATYIFFHLMLLIYYLIKTPRFWWRVSYGAAFIFEIILLYYTATRGAILGFLGAILLAGFILVIFSKERRSRLGSLSLLAVVLLLVVGFYFVKDTEFVRESYTLSRFRGISLSETTTQSRFLLWNMAWQGFKERPILGWGPENFNLLFSKYYDPRMWRQEPWFDRAHDFVFDWLTATGIVGFLAYLSIFVSAIFLILKNMLKRDRTQVSFTVSDTAVFVGFLGGYVFQNLFVFDNLTSYFLFFSVLGFIHFKHSINNQEIIDEAGEIQRRPKPSQLNFITPVCVFLVVILSLYFINLKPILASRSLLMAIKSTSEQGTTLEKVFDYFKNALNYNTFGTPEIREQIATFANSLVVADNIPQNIKVRAVSMALPEAEKQVSEYPNDPRNHLVLGSLYNSGGKFADAIKVYEEAQRISPRRPQILFVLAETLIRNHEMARALEIAHIAYDLDTTYGDAARNLASVAIINGKIDFGEDLLEKHFGSRIVADATIINAYVYIGDFKKVVAAWEKFVASNPDVAQHHVNLAAAYLKIGEREKAIKALKRAVELDSSFKDRGESLIEEIKAGRNPS